MEEGGVEETGVRGGERGGEVGSGGLRVGVGPGHRHVAGPWRAACVFVCHVAVRQVLQESSK